MRQRCNFPVKYEASMLKKLEHGRNRRWLFTLNYKHCTSVSLHVHNHSIRKFLLLIYSVNCHVLASMVTVNRGLLQDITVVIFLNLLFRWMRIYGKLIAILTKTKIFLHERPYLKLFFHLVHLSKPSSKIQSTSDNSHNYHTVFFMPSSLFK